MIARNNVQVLDHMYLGVFGNRSLVERIKCENTEERVKYAYVPT